MRIYNPVRNEIVFPAAILQPPFFNMEADDAANYGGIGGVIGHEMGHGFDDQGRNFDAQGVLRDWWTKEDAEEYQKRAKVIVEHYNQLEPMPGLKVNGALTLGENIADLTGLALPTVPTGSHSGTACTDARRPQRRRALLHGMGPGLGRQDARRCPPPAGDDRSSRARDVPGQRAGGSIPEFYATFHVKEGDKMYLAPDQRAKIW